MKNMVFQKELCILLLLTVASRVHSDIDQPINQSSVGYLEQYGYLPSSSQHGTLLTEDTMRNALIRFQKMANISQTGVADEATKTAMGWSRCGVKDEDSDSSSRRKRYTTDGSRFARNDLTYRIVTYTQDLPRHYVDSEIQRALNVWSRVTPLTFTRKDNGLVDIEIIFAASSHGDGSPFDGPGRVLAHAFFPRYGGDAHFDDAETWTVGSFTGTNLFQVAAHEFGHSLGLKHSEIRAALMAPFYRGYQPSFKLHSDDVSGIQRLYGRNTITTKSPKPTTQSTQGPTTKSSVKTTQPTQRSTTTKPTTTTSRPTTTPQIRSTANPSCQPIVPDAITTTANGLTYMFQGNYYYLITSSGVPSGYPRQISMDWRGLPSNLDSALYLSSGYTFFFKRNKYWKFYNRNPVSGYPRYIRSGFPGIPNNIDASFVWGRNRRIYFIKGNEYYRYSGTRDYSYPRPLSVWRGIPSHIDAAFQYGNGRTFFFSGTNYYRFNDWTVRVDNVYPPYPREMVAWWICPMSGSLIQADDDNDTTMLNDTVNHTNPLDESGLEANDMAETDEYLKGEMSENMPVEDGVSASTTTTSHTFTFTLVTVFVFLKKYISEC